MNIFVKIFKKVVIFALIGACDGVTVGAELPPEFNIPLDGKKSFTFSRHASSPKCFLTFSARINAGKWQAGAQPALKIQVNGIDISTAQLANKGDYFHYNREMYIPWFQRDNIITLVYYPWQKRTQLLDRGFAFDFVFDITNMLKPSANHLVFINRFKAMKNSEIQIANLRILNSENFAKSPQVKEKAPFSWGSHKLRAQAQAIHQGNQIKLACLDDFASWRQPDLIAPRIYQAGNYQLTDLGTGELLIRQNEIVNRLKSSWQVGSQKFYLKNNKVISDKLKVSRQIEKTPLGVIVRDTMSNLTSEDLPVIFDNQVLVDLKKLKGLRFGGQSYKSFNLNSDNLTFRGYSMTPLVFLQYAQQGLGIYLEDDRYRNQYSAITVENSLHLVDDMFYLAPGSSYTVVWKLYPVPENNYYTLLNMFRQDYKLYQNIPGLFGFVYPMKDGSYERYYRKKLDTPEKVRRFLDESGITIPCVTPILPSNKRNFMCYGSEPVDIYRKSLEIPRNFLDLINMGKVKTPLLMYTDVHLVITKGTKEADGQGNWRNRLADSLFKDHRGKVYAYRNGWLYHVAPTLHNTAGRQIVENFNCILAENKFAGVFLDEWNYSNQRVGYNISDGTSALLDKQGNIVRKIAIKPLYCKDFLVQLGRRVSANGRIAFANTFDCLTDLMALPLIHFAEPVAHEDSYLLAGAQAGRTPLSLSCKRGTTAWSDVKYFLRQGILGCFYATRMYGNHVLKKVYPITVREIHPGIVIGTDRIVTCRSGKYTLGDKRQLTAWIYSDPQGLFKRKVSGKNVLELSLNSDQEVAVIVAE